MRTVRARVSAVTIVLSLLAGTASVALPVAAADPVPRDSAVPRSVARVDDDVTPARALLGRGFAISRSDGNDTDGPLDLASMRAERGGSQDEIRLVTQQGVTNADLDVDDGNFAILIDTNDNERYDYAQYVFFASGKLRAILVKLSTGRIADRSAAVSRLSARSFRTLVSLRKLHNPATYRFAATSYYEASPCSRQRPCIDTIPNRLPLIPMDHGQPIADADAPSFSTDVSSTTTFPVHVVTGDDPRGTGVASWAFQVQEDGGVWTTVDSGGNAVDRMVDVIGQEGSSYRYRLRVVDEQRNEKITAIRTTPVPIDQNGGIVDFSTGDWDATAEAWAWGGTMRLSNDPAEAQVTGTFTGTRMCVMGGHPSADGSASVTIDGLSGLPVFQSPTSILGGEIDCSLVLSSPGPHTFVLSVYEGTVAIDGFYFYSP
jgi:hypothetical protein